MTQPALLHPSDPFPAFTMALPGGDALRLPDALAGHFSVIPIPDDVRQLLAAPHYAHLSTLRPDGSPRKLRRLPIVPGQRGTSPQHATPGH